MDEPLNILIITSRLPPYIGGVSIYSAEIARSIQQQGHRVTVLMRDRPPEKFSSLGLDIISLPTKGLIKGWTLRRSRRKVVELIRQRGIEIVFFAYPVVGWGNLYSLLAREGIPYVVAIHTANKKNVLSPRIIRYRRRKWGLNHAKRVITCSKWVAKEIEPLVTCPIDPIYHGVNPQLAEKATPEKMEDKRKEFQLEGKRVILCLGRFTGCKNFDVVIAALPNLIERFPNLLLMMVGEGKEEYNWRTLAKELKVEDHILWVPKVPSHEVGIYYKLAEVFITVSSSNLEDEQKEAFGLVYIEANLCGTPVIGGKGGGIPEAVLDGETGLLIPSRDREAMEKALWTLLEDEELRKKLGATGEKRAREYFTWDRSARETVEALRKALGRC